MDIALKGLVSFENTKIAYDWGIRNFTFDHRPKSFNFLQMHELQKWNTILNRDVSISIEIENEKDIMVNSILDRVEEVFNHDIFSLEFFNEDRSIYDLDKFNIDYSLHYRPSLSLSSLNHAKKLNRLIINYDLIQEFQGRGELFGFCQLLSELPCPIEVLIDWDSDLSFQLFEYLPIETLSFEINPKVELGYRQPDMRTIIKVLNYLEENMNVLKRTKNENIIIK